MSEGERKKTILVWHPPTAAATKVTEGQEVPTGPVTQKDAFEPTISSAVVAGTAHAAAHHAGAGPMQPGELIGARYKVLALIGQGGFAAVYRAADNEIPNHEICVKLLNDRADGSLSHEAQLRELSLIASVSHPSVVQFKDYGWHDGRLYFVMPWYRGKTLSAVAPLDRPDARRVFERSAYALQAMHDAGICHYDIKPDNIFLADIAGFEAGFPVLLDLGIAAKRGEKPTALTPEYCSPETASSMINADAGTQVGPPADVFALALSLRNMLDPGDAPLVGDSLVAFLGQRATQPIGAPTRKDLLYLKPHFERWLSLDPSDRPSAAEFAVELSVLTAPEERRAERRRMLLRALPFLALFAVIVVALTFALRSKTNELVQQKQHEEQASLASNKRFEQLKLQSKNALDDKLLLAQEFQTQRDQFRTERDQVQATLGNTARDLARTQRDLQARTKERDQTRSALQAQSLVLETTKADLARSAQLVEQKKAELAQARENLAARKQDLEQRTQERDKAAAELAKRKQELDALQTKLATQTAQLATQTAQLAAQQSAVKAARAELAAKAKELEKLTAASDKAKAQQDSKLRTLEQELKQKTAALEKAQTAAKTPAKTKKTKKPPTP